MKKVYLLSLVFLMLNAGCVSSRKTEEQASSVTVKRTIAQQSSFVRSQTPLFQTYESMELTLTAPLNRLFSVRARANAENPRAILDHSVNGTIEYLNRDGQKVSLNVTIKLRGNTSQDLSECPFPKMRFRFNKDQIRGTLFEGNEEINLGTHCGEGEERSRGFGRLWHSNSPEREAFVYRMLEILDIPGYKARSVQMKYVNTEDTNQYPQAYTAFFLEDVETIVKRHRGVEVRYNRGLGPVRESERVRYDFKTLEDLGPLDATGLIKIAYFQDFIHNTDWSLPLSSRNYGFGMLWNMKVFVHGQPSQVVVMPYDFDLAYMVCANSRWRSQSGSSIANVFSEDQRRQVRDFFRSKRAELERAANDLNSDNRRFILEEINGFYNSLPN